MAKPLIDWIDDTSHVLINPHLPESIASQLLKATEPHQHLKGHIWLASSGTEHFPKMIALSKKAFLASAKAVNEHFEITKNHIWMNILPLFHTGGLSIHARAFLSGSPVFDFSEHHWDAAKFVERLEELDVSFSSVTPTHVFDLVQKGLRPPSCLQALIVGGGVLTESLHASAYALGWLLHKSYGMTETCSQVATAAYPHLYPKTQPVILNHVEMRFDADDFIEIKSDALLTGFVHGNDPQGLFIDPKVEGWFKTQDKGRILNDFLQVYGRASNFMKIGGENTNFSDLEMIWDTIRLKHKCHEDVILIDLPDERLGRKICLAATTPLKSMNFEPLIKEFHSEVFPIAKIRGVHFVGKIPRSELFKVRKEELRKLVLDELSQQFCEVSPSTLKGHINVPPSKSQTLRAILFASLAKGSSSINNLLDSADAASMINACTLLGAKIAKTETGIIVDGVGGHINAPHAEINAGNSGIVLRFMAAVAALSSSPILITGDHSIQEQRPMGMMLEALTMLGIKSQSLCNNGFAPLSIQGPMTKFHTAVDGKDSQPVSALLILGAFSKTPLEIEVQQPGELPWVQLTLDWLDFLGVPYKNEKFSHFQIGGGPEIQGFRYTVPGDMSSAAFSVTAAVIKDAPLIVHGLDFNDGQGDKRYFDILKQMGAKLTISREDRTLKIHSGSKLKGITVDINDCIDTICILAVAACYADGVTTITNASIARTKECNRIQALVEELSKMGATIKETHDGLSIVGSPLKGADVYSHKDHRLAMALAVAGLGASGTTRIKDVACIKKTYPSFIHDFNAAGANIHEYPS